MIQHLDSLYRGGIYRRVYKADSEDTARSFANKYQGSAIEEAGVWFVYI